MIETRIHSAAAAALISDEEQLTSAGTSSSEGSTGSAPEDFAATLQGLIASNGQIAGPQSHLSVLAAFTPDSKVARKPFDPPPGSATDRSTNPAWSSVLPSALLRVAAITASSSPSLQAVRAYALPTHSYQETSAAADPASSPADTTNVNASSNHLIAIEQDKTVSAPSKSGVALNSDSDHSVFASIEPIHKEIANGSAAVAVPPSHREVVAGETIFKDTTSNAVNGASTSFDALDLQSSAATIPNVAPLAPGNTTSARISSGSVTIASHYSLGSTSQSLLLAFSRQDPPLSPRPTGAVLSDSKVLHTFPAHSERSITRATESRESPISSSEGQPQSAGNTVRSTEWVQEVAGLQLGRAEVTNATGAGRIFANTATAKNSGVSVSFVVSETTHAATPNLVVSPGNPAGLSATLSAASGNDTRGGDLEAGSSTLAPTKSGAFISTPTVISNNPTVADLFLTPPTTTSLNTAGSVNHTPSSPNLSAAKPGALSIRTTGINPPTIATNRTTATVSGRVLAWIQPEPLSIAPRTHRIEMTTLTKIATSATPEGNHAIASPPEYTTGPANTSETSYAVRIAAEPVTTRMEQAPIVAQVEPPRLVSSQSMKLSPSAVPPLERPSLDTEESPRSASANIRLDSSQSTNPLSLSSRTSFVESEQSVSGVTKQTAPNMPLSSVTASLDKTVRGRTASSTTDNQSHRDGLADGAPVLSIVPGFTDHGNISNAVIVSDHAQSVTDTPRASRPVVNGSSNTTQGEKVPVTRIQKATASSISTSSEVTRSDDLTPRLEQPKKPASEQTGITATSFRGSNDQPPRIDLSISDDSYSSKSSISLGAKDLAVPVAISTDERAPATSQTARTAVNATADRADRLIAEASSLLALDPSYGTPRPPGNERLADALVTGNSPIAARERNRSSAGEDSAAATNIVDAITGTAENVSPQTPNGREVSHSDASEYNADVASRSADDPNAVPISGAITTRANRLLPEAFENEALPSSVRSSTATALAQGKPAEPETLVTPPLPLVKTQTPHLSIGSDRATASQRSEVAGGTTESAPIRQPQDLRTQLEGARVADVTVQLADGQTAHATVRERAGSIEVKIVTSSDASAQRVSSEVDTMRQNLDAAGLRLGQAEVSYQQNDTGRRDGQGQEPRPPQDAPNKDGSIFTLSEVAE